MERLVQPYRYTTSDGNYFVRHWRGDLSLGVSYWINGVFIGRFLLSLLILTSASVLSRGSGQKLQIQSAIVLVGLIAAFLVPIWSYVGIWRAADHHADRGGSAGWALVARIMVVIGTLSTLGSLATSIVPGVELARLAIGKDSISVAVITASRDGQSLYLSGQLGEGSARLFQSALAANPDAKSLELNSPGGRIGEALDIAEAIRKRGFNTYVTGLCASACTLIFIAGHERAATPNAQIGFHSTSFAGHDLWSNAANDAYQKAGLPPSFLMHVRGTPSKSMWYPTRDELASYRIVTRTSLGGESTIGLADRGINSQEALAAQLKAQPIWITIDKRFPGSSDRASKATWDVKANGGTDADAFLASRTIVHQLFQQALKTTDDPALDAFAALHSREITAARSISVQACELLLDGKLNIHAVLPKAVIDEDTRVEEMVFSEQRKDSSAVAKVEYNRQVLDLLAKLPPDQHAYFLAPKDYANQPELRCRAELTLFNMINAMPQENRAIVLRGMWQKRV